MTLDCSPETLTVAGMVYRHAAVAFGATDVDWWVEMQPTRFGPEVRLRVVWRQRPDRRTASFALTQSGIRNETAEQLDRCVGDVVRRMRRQVMADN